MPTESQETTPLLSTPESQQETLRNDVPNETDPIVTAKTIPPVPNDSVTKPADDDDNDDTTGPPDAESADIETKPRVSMLAIFPSVAIGVFLSAMDTLVVASAYGRIGSELHELSKASWLATAYLITMTSIQPLYGKLSDIFGRKACLLFAYTVFSIGSAWCGFARTMNELIAARAFAGIGGGGLTTIVSILMSDLVPLQSRGTWQGLMNIVFATGASAGAPLGGVLADKVGWRWAFWMQVPLTILAATMVSIFLRVGHHDPTANESSTWKKFKRVDFSGAATLIAAVVSLLVALDRGGKISWKDTIVLVTGSVSVVLFFVFFYIEGHVATAPFAPPRIVFDRGLFATFMSNFFCMACFYAVLFYIPLYFQAVAGLSASQSGAHMIPAIGGSVLGSISGGLIMQKTGKFYLVTVIAFCLGVVGVVIVLLSTGLVVRNFTLIGISLFTMGLGSGTSITTTLIAIIARAGPKDQAVATAVSYLFRSLGSVVGVSLGSTVLQGALRKDLRDSLKGIVAKSEIDAIVKQATASLEFLKDLRPEVKEIVVNSYEKAIRYPFIMTIGFGVLAIISSCFIIEHSLKDAKTPTNGDGVRRQDGGSEYGSVPTEERS